VATGIATGRFGEAVSEAAGGRVVPDFGGAAGGSVSGPLSGAWRTGGAAGRTQGISSSAGTAAPAGLIAAGARTCSCL